MDSSWQATGLRTADGKVSLVTRDFDRHGYATGSGMNRKLLVNAIDDFATPITPK